MREILFRGKRTDTSEWVEGNLVLIKNYAEQPYQCFIISQLSYLEYGEFDEMYQVFPETLCEFTGLYDKNGNRIFESDIHERENHFFVVKYGKYRDCETNDDGYGWYFEYTHRNGCESFDGTESQYVNIIGNSIDNPELLTAERIDDNEN